MLEKQARLISGLILAVYVFLHVINHCLGLISIDAMEAMLHTVMAPWKTAVGGVLLDVSDIPGFGNASPGR